MKRLTAHIEIGDLVFDFVHQVVVSSSWKSLTDTAQITLPRNVKMKDGGVLPNIPIGEKVSIRLGYDNANIEVFSGYVVRIDASLPVVIECEDEMWKLKQTRVSQSWNKVSLRTMLEAILPTSIMYDAPDVDLGAFRIDQASIAKVLETLQAQYGLRSYFQDNVLFVGFAHARSPEVHEYDFSELPPVRGLQYRLQSESLIQVRAVSMMPDNTKIEVQLGDEGGEQRTLHYYNLDTETLQARAESELSRLRINGYRGSFEAFGVPICLHGDNAQLTDSEYPDRAGTYLVDRVDIEFGQGGYRRHIHLGGKL